VQEILLFNMFFRLSIHALVAKIEPDNVVQWCADGEFLRQFCVLYFQRAAGIIFQTRILNSHSGHIMCRSKIDIQSATAENRRGKTKKERKKKKPQRQNIRLNGLPCWAAIMNVIDVV